MWNNEGYAWGIAKIRNWGMITYIILQRAWELMTKGSKGEGVNAWAKVWEIANGQGNMGATCNIGLLGLGLGCWVCVQKKGEKGQGLGLEFFN